MKPRSQEIRLRTSPGRLRQKPTGPFGGHYAPSPTALFLPYAVIVLVGFPLLLAGCTGTRSIPVGPTAPPLPIVPTAPWTPERDDDAGAVVMVCRDRSSGPRCIPYGARAAADAWSTCGQWGTLVPGCGLTRQPNPHLSSPAPATASRSTVWIRAMIEPGTGMPASAG